MKKLTPATSERVAMYFKPRLNPLEDKIRDDVSACARTGDYLWLAFDESTHVERLHWTGKTWAEHETFPVADFLHLEGDEDEEIDIEGMEYADHYLWITGSQSKKRDKPDPDEDLIEQADDLADIEIESNRYVFGRIPCVPDERGEYRLYECCPDPSDPETMLTAKQIRMGSKGNKLTKALEDDPHLKPFMKLPCKDNGLDIEGLAVCGDRIFLGLRGPVLRGWAVILEVQCKEKKGVLKPRKIGPDGARYRKHFVKLGGMGIRELLMASDGSLLVLGGPTMDLDGTISLWRLPRGLPEEDVSFTREAWRVYDVTIGPENGHGTDKAEGIAELDDGRFLIVYDAPSAEHRLGQHDLYGDIFPAVA